MYYPRVPQYNLRLLIAEDSPEFLQTLLAFLHKVRGIEVAGTARSVALLPDLLKSTPAEVLLLDVTLEDGTSLPLLQSGAIPSGMSTVVMTSHPSPSLEKEARRLGAALFVDKETGLPSLMEWLSGVASSDTPVSSD